MRPVPGPGWDWAARERWLAERLGYWQMRLRLLDWRISARFVPAYDVEENYGDVNADPKKRNAVVRIADPAEPPAVPASVLEPDPLAVDPEVVLVHELLHVAWDGFTRDTEDGSPADVALEAAIHTMSEALVEMERR